MDMCVARVSFGTQYALYRHVVLFQREAVVVLRAGVAMADKVFMKGRQCNDRMPYALIQVCRLNYVRRPDIFLDECKELRQRLFLKELKRAQLVWRIRDGH